LFKIKPVAINLKPDGMDLDDLEQHLKQLPPVDLSPGRPFRAAVYVMTVHHNPTGICYSAGLRHQHPLKPLLFVILDYVK